MTLHTTPIPLTSTLSSSRGAVGDTWWGRKFLETVIRSNDYNRLNSGKSYARSGRVQWIEASPCSVEAKVAGSYIYAVRIRFTPLSDESWRKFYAAIAGEVSFVAQLMAGHVPETMERLLVRQGISIFPAVDPKSPGCNCPDRGDPCKHKAAVYFLIAENIDKDPFLIFLFLGKTREVFLSELRQARMGLAGEPGDARPVRRRSGQAGQDPAYYRMNSEVSRILTDLKQMPVVNESVLKGYLQERLGRCPSTLGETNLGTIIGELYPRAAKIAARWAEQMQGWSSDTCDTQAEKDNGSL